jgi:ADP-heptose:LPS heptosyltransferase
VGGTENRENNNNITRLVRQKNKSISTVDFSGSLDLKTLCPVLKAASLFVGIDSGVMHIASCLDLPVVGLYGPTDPFYVGPQNHRSAVVREESMCCVPCYLKPCDHHDCMKNLGAEKVFKACRDVLNKQVK